MLGGVSKARHAAVGGTIGVMTMLTASGAIGEDNRERFDTWQVVVEPAGGDGLRITETFDQDFRNNDRRGPLRLIPNDFGEPTAVTASSPDAPDDVRVIPGFETEIRIGDPDVTINGQHRYTLSYTLPEARIGEGFLAYDVLAGDRYRTERAEVVVRGFELDEPRCFIGDTGSTEQCELRRDGDVYRADLGELPPNTGVTIDGRIVGSFATEGLPQVEPLPLPEPPPSNRLPLSAAAAALGAAAVVPIYRSARRRGRNEVYSGGAADAALGSASLPAPGAGAGAGVTSTTTLVTDDELAGLATTEFAPPKGLQPWEAAALLRERLDGSSVEAWLSGLAGREAVELTEQDDALLIASGPKRADLAGTDAELLDALLRLGDPYRTGTYDPNFEAVWDRIAAMQSTRIRDSGWWRHGSPVESPVNLGSVLAVTVFLGVIALIVLGTAGVLSALFGWWPLALAFAVAVPTVAAYAAYARLRPSRSAAGSALALQAESFRRFLHASEAKHVEWAWERGVLREYSGWAVALDETIAWGAALAAADVPPPARLAAAPIMVAGNRSSLNESRTRPSSSGSSGGGGGGFRGGSVGGGGGGGSRGSW
jgi:uncharacterized membrane protein YgcG